MNLKKAFGRRQWLVSTALTGLGSVAAQAAPVAATSPKPALVNQTKASKRKPKVAVVLGGGSVRGFAHIGVIKALEASGIKPDVIYGCSAGALVGAFWASGFSGWKMEALAYQVRDEAIIDLVSGDTSGQVGMVSGAALQKFVNQGTSDTTIEALPTKFRAIATEFPSGEAHVFSRGDLGFAVRASCSIPGIFMPARLNGKKYLDGGLVSPMPIQIARKEGYDLIIAVDVGGADPGAAQDTGTSLFQVLLRSFDIMGGSLRRLEASQADIVIRPDVTSVKSTDFASRKVLIEAGFKAADRLIPVIQEKLKT